MGNYLVFWCIMSISTLLRPSVCAPHPTVGPTRPKKEKESFELPITAGVADVVPLNLSTEYITFPITTKTHSENEPRFDTTMPRTVTAYRGKAAFLTCRIPNMGNRTVSWVRGGDAHILSVGSYIYSTNQRYNVITNRTTNEWTLQIKWVNTQDAGLYGCHVNSDPVKIYYITLRVVGAPVAKIPGEGELYLSVGSTLNLACILNSSDSQLFWYHNGDIINYDSIRGGVTIIVEKSNKTVSTLQIKNAKEVDSGNYTCSPSNANAATTVVHVIKDLPADITCAVTNCPALIPASVASDQPAAMHKGGAADGNAKAVAMGLLIVISYNRPSLLPYASATAMSFFMFSR